METVNIECPCAGTGLVPSTPDADGNTPLDVSCERHTKRTMRLVYGDDTAHEHTFTLDDGVRVVLYGRFDGMRPDACCKALRTLHENAVRYDYEVVIETNSPTLLMLVGDDNLIPFEAVTYVKNGVARSLPEIHDVEWLKLFSLPMLYLQGLLG